MKMKVIYMLSLFFIISCSDTEGEKIVGRWEINEISFNKKDYSSYLYSNILIFENNESISLPETVHFIKDNKSNWKIENDKIIITTTNLAFKDTFQFSFIRKDKKNPRGLILKSDSIYIKLYNLFDLED